MSIKLKSLGKRISHLYSCKYGELYCENGMLIIEDKQKNKTKITDLFSNVIRIQKAKYTTDCIHCDTPKLYNNECRRKCYNRYIGRWTVFGISPVGEGGKGINMAIMDGYLFWCIDAITINKYSLKNHNNEIFQASEFMEGHIQYNPNHCTFRLSAFGKHFFINNKLLTNSLVNICDISCEPIRIIDNILIIFDGINPENNRTPKEKCHLMCYNINNLKLLLKKEIKMKIENYTGINTTSHKDRVIIDASRLIHEIGDNKLELDGELFEIIKKEPKEKKECSICFKKPKPVGLLAPCLHKDFCYNCVQNISNCPICRQVVSCVVKI